MPFQWLESSTANTLELTPISFTTKLEVDFAALLEALEGKVGKWSEVDVTVLQARVVYDQPERVKSTFLVVCFCGVSLSVGEFFLHVYTNLL